MRPIQQNSNQLAFETPIFNLGITKFLRYPIIDGDLITADPLQKIINGDVKSDLGFYYHEDSHDEAGFQIDAISSFFIGLNSNHVKYSFENHERVTV